KAALGKIGKPADVGALEESGARLEARRVVFIHRVDLEIAAATLEIEEVPGAVVGGAVVEARQAVDGLRIEQPVLIESEMGVDAADAISTGDAGIKGAGRVGDCVEFAIGVDHANVAAVLADLAADANDSEIRLSPP